MKKLAVSSLLFTLSLVWGVSTAQAAITLTLKTSASTVALGKTLTLTATVSGTTNAGLTWSVNGVTNGNSATGTLAGSGLTRTYTAPPVDCPDPNPVTFKIVSAADGTTSVTATATVTSTVVVTLSPTSAIVALGGTQLFTATISNTTNTALNWYVNGVLNGNATQGTLTGCTSAAPRTCTYTAPALNPPNPSPAIIEVASVADPSKFKTASVTMPLNITATVLPEGAVGLAYNATLKATGGTGPYKWSIIGGGLPSCLSLSPSTGFITGTLNANTCGLGVSGDFGFVVKVTDSTTPTPQSATRSFSFVFGTSSSAVCESGSESVLKGQYAFDLIGYNSGRFTAVEGSITVDGKGNITGGEADTNGGLGSLNSAVSAGTYTVGADNRGCAIIVTTFGTFSTRFDLGAISSGTATQGKIMEFDPAEPGAFVASGQILQQTTANFSTGLNGGYVHFLTGFDSTAITGSLYYPNGGRIACDGVHTDSGNGTSGGTITAGEQYCNVEGVAAASGLTTGITGTYSSIDEHGRLTETVTGANGTYHLVGYMTSTAEKLMVNTDPNPVVAGVAFQQSGGPYSKSSLDKYVVMYGNGMNSSTSGKIQFILAHGNGISTFYLDEEYENDGGTWIHNPSTGSCTYTVLANGRLSGCSGGIYLAAANTAVYVGSDVGGFAGYLIPQTGRGSFTTASMTGTFFGGTTEIVNQGSTTKGEVVTLFGSESPNLSVITDNSSTTDQQADQVHTATFTVASNGTFTTSDHPGQVDGLVIDSTHILAGDSINSSYPTLSLYGPSTGDSVALSITSPKTLPTPVVNGAGYGITVKVAGTSDTNVTFTLNGIAAPLGTVTPFGTITGSYPSFTYTAPAWTPNTPKFNITVASNQDVSKTASLSVTMTPSPLTIIPTAVPNAVWGRPYNCNFYSPPGSCYGSGFYIQTNGGTAPFTWTIASGSLPPVLSLSGGLISGVPQQPGTFSFTAQVTDSSSPPMVASRQFSITVFGGSLPPLRITTTSLPDATVGVPYSALVNVTGGTGSYIEEYAYTSAGETFPSCLYMWPTTGLLVGTPVNTCVGSFTFNVAVVDSSYNQVTQPVSININPAPSTVCESGNESVLSGQYAFNLTGYNKSGFNAVVGSISTDGAGHITGGEIDTNSSPGPHTNSVLSASTYTVGPDNRGCATIKTTSESFSTRFVLGSISGSPSTAKAGRILEFDPVNPSAFIATGQILKQTNFSAGLSGSYSFQDVGVDAAGSRFGIVGVFSATSSKVSAGEGDFNDAGTLGNYTGETGSYGSPDANGRVVLTTSVPSGPTTHSVGYLASGANFLGLTTDPASPNGILAVEGVQQSGAGTFSNGSFSGPMVMFNSGLAAKGGGTGGKAEFALISANGKGSETITDYDDYAGTWEPSNPTILDCTYSVASNGRGTFGGPCAGTAIFYATAANTGFVLSGDVDVAIGQVEPQKVPAGGFTVASVAGTFFGGTADIVSQDDRSDNDLVTVLSGSGAAILGTSVSDETSSTDQQADDVEPISGTTLGSNGTITETNNGAAQVAGVAIDSTHFMTVDHSGSSYPTVEVFGPSSAYKVTVTINGASSSSANVTAGTTLGLTVAVKGTTNTGVTWTVNGTPNGSGYLGYGTITGSGSSFTYHPPDRVPSIPTFSITATSNADVSKSASVSVTILAGAGVSPLSITTTSLPGGTVGTQYSQNIQTNGGTLPVYPWSVTSGSLPPGLVLQYEPNGVGMITGTPTAKGTYTFTVTASDASIPPKTAKQQFTVGVVNPPLTIITTSLPGALVNTPYSEPLQASGGTPPYTWSVASGSSLPGWLSIGGSGTAWTISGMPPAPGASTFSLTVTDSTTPTHHTLTQPLSITITAPTCGTGNESVLNGQYAFSLSGFNQKGYLAEVGSFTVDGHGKITAGEIDSNGALGIQHAGITTSVSSYSVGSDNRGCATIVTPFRTFTTRFAVGTLSSGKATEGRMIEWETGPSAYIATGHILQQTASSFSGGLSGSYAFDQSGVDQSKARFGLVGVISAASGSITTGEQDYNDAGTMDNITGITGKYASADANGRFTFTMTAPSTIAGSTTVGYMVSSSQFLILSTDTPTTNPVAVGLAQKQSGTFSNSSMKGNVVLYLTGQNGGEPGGRVIFGLASPNGSGSIPFTTYEDDAGVWYTPNPSTFTCTYSVASNGRVTLSGSGCAVTGAVFYLTGANTGFLLGSGHSVLIGQFEPQSAGPFTDASISSGTLYFGNLEVVNQGQGTAVVVFTLNGSGGLGGTSDYTSTTNQEPDRAITGTITVNSNGTFSISDYPGVISNIIISNSKFVSVDNQTDTYPAMAVGKK